MIAGAEPHVVSALWVFLTVAKARNDLQIAAGYGYLAPGAEGAGLVERQAGSALPTF